MVDRTAGARHLDAAWRALGRRVAVFGGSLVGLLALLEQAPASTAALRGGVAWLGVLGMVRLSGRALRLAHRFDAPLAPDEGLRGERCSR